MNFGDVKPGLDKIKTLVIKGLKSRGADDENEGV